MVETRAVHWADSSAAHLVDKMDALRAAMRVLQWVERLVARKVEHWADSWVLRWVEL